MPENSTCFEIRAVQSTDAPSELFYIYCKDLDSIPKIVLDEMLKSARHIERHFLNEAAFVIVSFKSSLEDDHAHICRHVWLPHFAECVSILSQTDSRVACLNTRAADLLINTDITRNFLSINFENFDAVMDAHNIFLFYVDSDKPIHVTGEDFG